MIKKLAIERLIDYKKRDLRDPFYYYSTIINNLEIAEDNSIHVDRIIDKFNRDGADPSVSSTLLTEMTKSTWSMNIAKSEHIYRKGGSKNYIPSQPLLSLLSKMSVDCPATEIPMDYKAYFELSGFLGIGYVLVDLTKHDGDTVVRIAISDHNEKTEGWYFGIKVKDGENILESLNNTPFHEYDSNMMKNFPTSVSDTHRKKVQTVLNLIIYTTNPNEEFEKQFNAFNVSHNKAQKEKQTYTDRPYTLLGHDAEFLRLITVETGSVNPFPRWQPCGPGRTQRKLIIVKAHERNYKKLHVVQ